MSVREGTIEDAAAVALVQVRAWQAAYAGMLPDVVLDALDPMERAQRLRVHLADPTRVSTLFVGVRDTVIVGFAEVGPSGLYRDRDRLDPDVGEVYALYVDPPYWGAGAGWALMRAALAHLSVPGPRPVQVWVLNANERARRFYERCGFVADGTVGTFAVHQPDGTVVGLDEVRYVAAASPAVC